MKQHVLRHPGVTILAVGLLATLGACGPAGDETPREPSVLVTVANDRHVEVDGEEFDKGQHRGRPAKGAPQGRALVRVGNPGTEPVPVSMRSAPEDSLVLIHVVASTTDSTILVYGAYGSEIASMNQEASDSTAQAALFGALNSPAAVSGWECIWCRGGVLACGVEPDCGPGGGDSLSMNQ